MLIDYFKTPLTCLVRGFNIFSEMTINEARDRSVQMLESKHHEHHNSGRNSHVVNVEKYSTDILSPELCFLDLCKTELSKVGQFYASECIYAPLLFIILLSSFSSVFTEFVGMFLSFLCCSSLIMTHYLLCHCKERGKIE